MSVPDDETQEYELTVDTAIGRVEITVTELARLDVTSPSSLEAFAPRRRFVIDEDEDDGEAEEIDEADLEDVSPLRARIQMGLFLGVALGVFVEAVILVVYWL